ncbi:MAG: CRISPR-associated RAMP family protein [Chloroflexi bacterium UTCFX4]|nr:MAG: CRISPR-associated RAMP family protein [Chloroflexi bacterium UTCFX4]
MSQKHTSLNFPREKNGEQFYARAPYNFVPLPEKVVTVGEPPDHDHYEGNTGYLECVLETKSPLYVRGMMEQTSFEKWGDKSFSELPNDEAKQKRAKFFMLRANEPVIPGSSLRGMIRALVEIVGYGKVQPVTDKQMLYRAVGDPASLGQYYRAQMLGTSKVPSPNTQLDYPLSQLRGGYLRVRDGSRSIQPAMQHHGESFIHVEYADARAINIQQNTQTVHQVLVTPAPRSPSNRGRRNQGNLTLDLAIAPSGGIAVRHRGQTPNPGMVEATLVVSGHMGGQHPKHWHCAIYAPDPAAPSIRISDEKWKSYEEDRDMTRGFPTRKLQQEGDPLFYLVDANGQLQFFGPTMMFRLPYLRTANDFVPEQLRRESDLDLAEAMFGCTKQKGEGKARAYASRVFVSDAKLEAGQGDVWLMPDEEILTPRILSSPKPTTFQHYLTQGDDAAREKKNLKHYASDLNKTEIRGHKLYWHKGEVSRQDIELEPDKDKQQLAKQLTGIKPVRAGVTFKFRVNFENLNDAELGALLWVLGLPDGYCQALGMGKPLGMGAVKITPTLYLSNRNQRYARLFENDKWADSVQQEMEREQFTRAFENFVLERMDAAERAGKEKLEQMQRIQMLLKMLEFPGPDRDWTRYMEIEPNEFKEPPTKTEPVAHRAIFFDAR